MGCDNTIAVIALVIAVVCLAWLVLRWVTKRWFTGSWLDRIVGGELSIDEKRRILNDPIKLLHDIFLTNRSLNKSLFDTYIRDDSNRVQFIESLIKRRPGRSIRDLAPDIQEGMLATTVSNALLNLGQYMNGETKVEGFNDVPIELKPSTKDVINNYISKIDPEMATIVD